jgi:hypothetical protein
VNWRRLHSRLCAGVVLASSLAHFVLAVGGGHGPWIAAAMFGTAVACLACVPGLWRKPCPRTLNRVMSSTLTMVSIHSLLILTPSGGSGHGHAPSAASAAVTSADETVLLGVLSLEIVTAFVTSTLVAQLRRDRQPLGEIYEETTPTAISTKADIKCGLLRGEPGQIGLAAKTVRSKKEESP